MLLAMLAFYLTPAIPDRRHTFDMVAHARPERPQRRLQAAQRSGHACVWVWSLFIGFAIKVPVFPFHTWLPDAHVEAPTADLGHPGRRAAEDGHLRHAAHQLPDPARRRRM